jgi:hypothetical protein
MDSRRALIISPSASGPLGELSQFLQGALTRRAWNVRIAAGNHQGSGFADHRVIRPRWVPWFFRCRFHLKRFLEKQKADFPFHLLILIAPSSGWRVPTDIAPAILRIMPSGRGKSRTWSMEMRSHRFPSPSRTEFGALQDDDLAQTVWGIDSIPPAWTKSTLADWIEARLSLQFGIQHLSKSSPGPRRIKKKFRLDLRVGGETNLCHWVGLALAPIWAIRESGGEVEQVLLPASPNEFQSSSLGWLGVDQKRILVETTQEQYPDFSTPPEVPNQNYYAGLRPIFLRHASPHRFPSRTYISRTDASYRRVANERDVLTLLAHHNFGCMVASRLTLAEQIASFRDSKIIVAPHGAALTLLFCCSPDVVLCELMPGHEERTCFRDISSQFKVGYYRLSCQTKGRQSRRRREADLIAPLRCLQFFVTQQIEKPSRSFGVARLTSGRA